MSPIEICLLIVGIIFVIGSFILTEKLSSKELEKLAEVTSLEFKKMTEKGLEKAKNKADEMMGDVVENLVEDAERTMEKDTNDKIKAISEYSETVLEQINKAHTEVMFLYSMLNDKEAQVHEWMELLNEKHVQLEKVVLTIKELQEQEIIIVPQEEPKTIADEMEEENRRFFEEFSVIDKGTSNNKKILDLYKSGKGHMDIARELGLGLGEVKLVIDLFQGEKG